MLSKKKTGGFLTKDGFRKFFFIYLLFLLIAVVLVLGVYRLFTVSFEKAQPDGPVRDFIESLEDDHVLYSLLNEKLSVSAGAFETREQIIRGAYMQAVRAGDLAYGREYAVAGESESENEQDFAVYLNEQKIFTLTVERHPRKAGFFMDSWSLWDSVVHQEGFGVVPTDYQVVAPAGASVTVNGKDASGVTQTSENVVLCSFEEEALRADVCRLNGMYVLPEIAVVSDGQEMQQTNRAGSVLYYLDGGDAFRTCTFTVPYGMEVYLNGTMLNKANCFSYEKADYPAEAASPYGMPETYRYTVRYLRREPEVTANYYGVDVEPMQTGNAYSFTYPAEMLYTLRVEVPDGADVTVGGIPLEKSAAATERMSSFKLGSYASYLDNFPMTQVYLLEGLYLVPEVEVTLAGQPLTREPDSSVGGRELLYTYLPAASEELQAEQEAKVKKFVRAYVTYTGQGKYNLSSNLHSLLDLCIRKSGAYQTAVSAQDELIWATQYSGMEYNYLTTSDYVRLSDDCYVCKAAFSVDVSRAGVVKHSEVSMSILMIHTGGEWKVAEFSYL